MKRFSKLSTMLKVAVIALVYLLSFGVLSFLFSTSMPNALEILFLSFLVVWCYENDKKRVMVIQNIKHYTLQRSERNDQEPQNPAREENQ